MRLTQRDISLVRDIALSHLLSRDQVLALGYFSSISRANVRLKQLVEARYLSVLVTPFYNQNLYVAANEARTVVGEKIGKLLLARKPSPQFLQHALAVTNVRIGLRERGFSAWRFEQQLWQDFTWRGQRYEVRPDGLAYRGDTPTFLEVDLGHVSRVKFQEKLQGYRAYLESGRFADSYGLGCLCVLVVTTGNLRKSSLQLLLQASDDTSITFKTFGDLNVACPGAWR